ncbi:MAG TPA: response regulator transcription factor [Pyrinomonadaceae bacterium]|jgi:DNA-binding NarL/FixJ family response regulator|nr:response regulator transcription factor [Pyrinomonadaceae bacterium]
MKVLIADDHAIVRRGLRHILAEEFSRLEVGEARNAQEALRLARDGTWDIIVLDISMPGRSGVEVLKELKQVCPKTPVLILTGHPEEQYAIRVLRAGAAGYMHKETAPDHLIAAVRKVIGGGRYISPALAEMLAVSLGGDSARMPHEDLSDREYQVLCMIASGKTVGHIADELGLSVKTISTYRARVLEKMGMKTSAELIHYAIRNNLTG